MYEDQQYVPNQYLSTLELLNLGGIADVTTPLANAAKNLSKTTFAGKVKGANVTFSGVQSGMLLKINAAGEYDLVANGVAAAQVGLFFGPEQTQKHDDFQPKLTPEQVLLGTLQAMIGIYALVAEDTTTALPAYASGDLLYASAVYSCLTKAVVGDPIAQVQEVLPNGYLRVVKF